MSINLFINRFLGIILLAAALLGLFINLPEMDISLIIILALGTVIFSAFFKVDLSPAIFVEDIKPIMLFFVLRYLLLPVAVYFLFVGISSFYATAFLLLLLLPTAVSSPAFTILFGGNIKLSLKLLVITSFLSILSIPAISQLIISQKVAIDGIDLLMMMIYTIVYPFLLHLPFRANHTFRKMINNNGPLITTIGLSIIFIVSTSHNREIILGNPEKMLIYAIIAVGFYLASYVIGFYLLPRQSLSNRTAFSICSGANNIGLGVTLTALFFSGDTNIFFIISQLAWIFILIPLRYFFAKSH